MFERIFLIGGLCCSMFIFMPSVFATGSSGIDWANSTLKVEFSAESPFVPSFSCFGYPDRLTGPCASYLGPEDHCVWENLEALGFSDEEDNPPIDNCFRQAGDYITTTQLVDYADNTEDPLVANFTIQAGSPDPIISTLNPDPACSDLSLVANGQDSCVLSVQLLDRFGNPVTQLKGQAGYLYSDSAFPNDANRSELGATSFRDGVRVKMPSDTEFSPVPESSGGRTFTIPNGADDMTFDIDVTSWAPSMSRAGSFLGKTEAVSFNFQMDFPSIDPDGSVNVVDRVSFSYGEYSPLIGFFPWIKNLMALGVDPQEFILNNPTPFDLTRNVYSAFTGFINPTSVYVTYHNLPVEFDLIDMNFDSSPVAISSPTETEYPQLVLRENSGVVSGEIAFSSDVEYIVSTDQGPETFRYPSGALGSGIVGASGGDDHDDTPISLSLLGVSVEGKLIGSKGRGVFQDYNSVEIGAGYSIEDIREEIFENSYKITRGIDAISSDDGTVLDYDPAWFADENLVVIDNADVVFGAGGAALTVPSGQNTLIIRNANLIIEGSMAYMGNDDSFGVILINDTVQDFPTTGNIFVKGNVKNMVGTYFTEGGLATIPSSLIITNTGDVSLSDISNGEDNDTQLLLEGTILTHNTLGGGLRQTGGAPYMTPWGLTVDGSQASKEIAEDYDLHFMRTYSPDYDEDTNTQTNTSNCVPGGDAYGCDPNHAAMIIRYDGRVVQSPPPGFDTATFIER